MLIFPGSQQQGAAHINNTWAPQAPIIYNPTQHLWWTVLKLCDADADQGMPPTKARQSAPTVTVADFTEGTPLVLQVAGAAEGAVGEVGGAAACDGLWAVACMDRQTAHGQGEFTAGYCS